MKPHFAPFAAATLFAATLLTTPALADKVNLTYLENAPAPIGTVTDAEIAALAKSEFTHVVFAFVNFCTPDASSSRGFTCPGDDAVPVWNIKAAYDSNGDPFPAAQAAVKSLTDAGKTVYLSVGAWDNPETWDYFGPGGQRAITGAQRLYKFMDDYHITGVDYDMEDHDHWSTAPNTAGFYNLVDALVQVAQTQNRAVPPMSIAPYASDQTASDPFSIQWQMCEMARAGVTPALINRQYYSGGHTGNIPAAMTADMAPFTCADGTKLAVTPEILNPGIGIALTQLPADKQPSSPPNCENATTAPYFAACASIVSGIVAAQPDIAGVALWDYDGLLQSGQAAYPAAYPCEVDNALNGTSNSCQ